MHDTFLIENISNYLEKVSQDNRLKKITLIKVIVSHGSHLDKSTLLNHLKIKFGNLVGQWTDVQVSRQNIDESIAVIDHIEGEI